MSATADTENAVGLGCGTPEELLTLPECRFFLGGGGRAGFVEQPGHRGCLRSTSADSRLTSAETAIDCRLMQHCSCASVFFCRPKTAGSVENAEHVVKCRNPQISAFHPSGLRKQAFDINRPSRSSGGPSGSGWSLGRGGIFIVTGSIRAMNLLSAAPPCGASESRSGVGSHREQSIESGLRRISPEYRCLSSERSQEGTVITTHQRKQRTTLRCSRCGICKIRAL